MTYINHLLLLDSPPSSDPALISSSSAYEFLVWREDGWVLDPQSRLMAWVPLDLHHHVPHAHTLVISTKGSLKLGFNSAKLGMLWVECYHPQPADVKGLC